MASSSTMRSPGWCDGLTLAAQDIRLVDISALLSGAGGSSTNQLGIGSGVRPGANQPMQVAAATGLSVTVNPGFALVQGTTATNQGAYSACLDAAATLTCQTADSVNARIDSVCVTVTDNGDATSSAVVQVVTGTPAASPTAPGLPANSLRVGDVTVPANAVSLSSGNIADKRSYAAAAGGVKLVQSSAFYPTAGQGMPGDLYFNIQTGRLLVFNGTTLAPPPTAPFPSVTSSVGSGTATSTTYVTVASGSVTVDGSTAVKITATFKDVTTSGTAAGNGCTVGIFRDGTLLGNAVVKVARLLSDTLDGGAFFTVDAAPAAGTHTYALKVASQGAGHFTVEDGQLLIEAAAL